MARTRAEMRAIIVTRLGNRRDKDDVINTELDLGLQELTETYDFLSQISLDEYDTVDGTEEVELSSTTKKVLKVYQINGTMSSRVRLKTKSWLLDRFPNVSALSHGTPVFAYVDGTTLTLFPVNNGDFAIKVLSFQEAGVFEDDSTVCPVPELETTLLHWVTSQVFGGIERAKSAQWWNGRAALAYQRAQRGDGRRYEELKSDLVAHEGDSLIGEPWLMPFVTGD